MSGNQPKLHKTKSKKGIENAVLAGGGMDDYSDDADLSVLDELADLARTADVVPVARYYQRRQRPDGSTFLGKGKVEEIAAGVREHEADCVLFDTDLTPGQVRNLEEQLGCKVLDRSEVILDIFARHAKTQESRLQVELAQIRYTRPRLKRMWTHLSRIAGQGGIGSRGPGEKQIETDRRLIDRRIVQLERELAEIQGRRERLVASRRDELTVGLVGYTNAGKSTLMNRLTGAGVYQADKLFATLDTKTADFDLPSGKRVLLSDTVGFIDNLPHHLVASFHATLEEVRQARLLLHVVDAGQSEVEKQIATVHRVLDEEMDLRDRDEILVFNKIDTITDHVAFGMLKERHPDHVEISAHTGEGIDNLIATVSDFAEKTRAVVDLVVGVGDGKTLAELARYGEVLEQEYEGDDVHMRVSLPKEAVGRFAAFVVGE